MTATLPPIAGLDDIARLEARPDPGPPARSPNA